MNVNLLLQIHLQLLQNTNKLTHPLAISIAAQAVSVTVHDVLATPLLCCTLPTVCGMFSIHNFLKLQ